MDSIRFLMGARWLSEKARLELYPSFWLMRVKVLELAPQWDSVRLKLPLGILTRNIGGSMFGGSQAAVADPIPALACAKKFPGYSVWTRGLNLDFRKEGTTHLELRFVFPLAQQHAIQEELLRKGRSTPSFEYGLYLPDNTLCTQVVNTVAIRARGYENSTGGIELPSE